MSKMKTQINEKERREVIARHRAILRVGAKEDRRMGRVGRIGRMRNNLGRGLVLMLAAGSAVGATITGTLRDISIQALETKLMFAPTNEVLVTGNGLSAGPPKVVD